MFHRGMCAVESWIPGQRNVTRPAACNAARAAAGEALGPRPGGSHGPAPLTRPSARAKAAEAVHWLVSRPDTLSSTPSIFAGRSSVPMLAWVAAGTPAVYDWYHAACAV